MPEPGKGQAADQPAWRLLLRRYWATAAAAAFVLVLGNLNILGRPGYELALALGLTLPSLAAAATVLEERTRAGQPFDAFCRALARGSRMVVASYVAACLHALRTGACDLKEGSLVFFMGPGFGILLASVWGVVAAQLGRQHGRRRALAWAVALPLGSAAVQVCWFYFTPIVFAYDPFVGFFSGALYDTVLDFEKLCSYRLASLATLFACYVAFLHLARGENGRWQRRSLGRPGLLLCGFLAAIGSLSTVVFGAELGHWQNAGTLATQLGAKAEFGSCHVVYDERLPQASVKLFGRECQQHIRSIERWLGIDRSEPVQVFLFRDVGQKRQLMGAAHTSIAKPWRREIYVQARAYPHPVLRHELVHAVAESVARGPFGVAGSAAGLLPNPGLIEGLAVAAAPRRGPLSHKDWAAAMADLGLLPPISQLFGLGFFGSNSSVGYTAAGAFVDHIRQQFGSKVVRRWYGGEALPQLVGTPLRQLEAHWHQALRQRPISERARAVARARFDRPSVFRRRCPHAVDARVAQAGSQLAKGAHASALHHYQQALRLDPHHAGARFGVARCKLRNPNPTSGRAWLQQLSQAQDLRKGGRAWAKERLGDLALKAADPATAIGHYRAASAWRLDDAALRTLDLKIHYAADPLARGTLVALLIGEGASGPSLPAALDLLGQWRDRSPDDPTTHYLFARQHFNRGDYARARKGLDKALALPERVARVRTETLRLALLSCCALGLPQAARNHWLRYRERPRSEHQKQSARSLLQRCSQAANSDHSKR